MKFETADSERAAHSATVQRVNGADEAVRALLSAAAYSDESVSALGFTIGALRYLECAAKEIDKERLE